MFGRKRKYVVDWRALILMELLRSDGTVQSLVRRLGERTKGQVLLGTGAYSKTRSLESGGFLSSYQSAPTPENGNRASTIYRLTEEGRKEAKRHRTALLHLASAYPDQSEEGVIVGSVEGVRGTEKPLLSEREQVDKLRNWVLEALHQRIETLQQMVEEEKERCKGEGPGANVASTETVISVLQQLDGDLAYLYDTDLHAKMSPKGVVAHVENVFDQHVVCLREGLKQVRSHIGPGFKGVEEGLRELVSLQKTVENLMTPLPGWRRQEKARRLAEATQKRGGTL